MKIENIETTKQMITNPKGAHRAYQNALEAKRKTGDADQQERTKKRKSSLRSNCRNLKRKTFPSKYN